jgi:poly-beta-hydroxyalkanoate depolymerase
VPDDDKGALLTVSAKVTEKRDDNTALITITAACDDATVLGKAQAIVRLP